MVISQIIGGLGNQMFQYAAARSFALKSNTPLYLDISDFSDYGLHQGFELKKIFNCTGEIATECDLRRLLGWQYSPFVRHMLIRPSLASFRGRRFVVEPYFQYWDGLNDSMTDSYIVGYWQSEKYFTNFQSIIRKDFSFCSPMSQKNALIASNIENSNSISLHVRRGDYVSNHNVNNVHGVCSSEYYMKAINKIASKIQNPRFFVFSDDINWVIKNIDIGYQHDFINHNIGSESYNDMRLMSMCKHHIIANSSFSWWGAWLNAAPTKVVIAPKQWFADDKRNVSDLLPKNWVKL